MCAAFFETSVTTIHGVTIWRICTCFPFALSFFTCSFRLYVYSFWLFVFHVFQCPLSLRDKYNSCCISRVTIDFFPCFPYFPGKIYVGLCITSAVYPILCPSTHLINKKEFVCAHVHGQTQESFSEIASN